MEMNVLIMQDGPKSTDIERNIDEMISSLEAVVVEEKPDIVSFCEFGPYPEWTRTGNKKYFDWAEPVPGPVTKRFSQVAAKYGINIVLPLYERGRNRDFYNSAVFIDRKGELIQGWLPDGTKVNCYRKCHIPASLNYTPPLSEKYYFKPGPGFPIFKVDDVAVGCLICYDRSFPEAWRMLALQGAEVVFVVVATSPGYRSETWFYELQAAAMQNGIFVVACNRGGGPEKVEDLETFYAGKSALIDPFGKIVAQAPENEGPAVLRVKFDLSEIDRYRTHYNYMRDRRPELYSQIASVTFV